MRRSTKSRQYSELLLALASEQGMLEEAYRGLDGFYAVYRQQPALKAALASTHIDARTKEALLQGLFPELNPVTRVFLVQLSLRKDMKLLRQIRQEVETGYYKRSEQVRVAATTTEAISSNLEERIRNAVERTSGKKPEFTAVVDPEILGGMKLQVGNTILDGTLASQLQRLRESLIES